MSPRVSVLINCYNSASTLAAAVESALGQTWSDLELVIFDNGSEDGTADIVRSFKDLRIRYFRQDPTIILGEARNRIMAAARGEYLAFLDSDDLWLPTKIEKQVALIERAGVGLVFTDAIRRHVDDGSEIGYFRFMSHKPAHTNVFDDQLRHYTVANSTVLFRRSSLEALDHWVDPTLHICTDFDLFMRIIYRDGADYVAEPLAIYHVTGGSTINAKQDLLAEELARPIQNMIARWPQIERDYPGSLRVFWRGVDLQRAKVAWRKGEPGEARRYLWPHLGSAKHLLALFGTLMPYATATNLWATLQRARRTAV